jgi:hypothetical protein
MMRAVGALLLCVVPCGASVSADVFDPGPYLHPQQVISVGKHAMNLYCTGHGSPTVVLGTDGDDPTSAWRFVQPIVARTTRVCSYDPPGFGFSAPYTIDRLQLGIVGARLRGPLRARRGGNGPRFARYSESRSTVFEHRADARADARYRCVFERMPLSGAGRHDTFRDACLRAMHVLATRSDDSVDFAPSNSSAVAKRGFVVLVRGRATCRRPKLRRGAPRAASLWPHAPDRADDDRRHIPSPATGESENGANESLDFVARADCEALVPRRRFRRPRFHAGDPDRPADDGGLRYRRSRRSIAIEMSATNRRRATARMRRGRDRSGTGSGDRSARDRAAPTTSTGGSFALTVFADVCPVAIVATARMSANVMRPPNSDAGACPYRLFWRAR